MISSDLVEVRTTLARLRDDNRTAEATMRGMDHLRRHFSRPALAGIRLAREALATTASPDHVAEIMTTSIQALLEN